MYIIIKRLIFSILIIIFYKIGTFIPLPGINIEVLEEILNKKNDIRNNNRIDEISNILTGGALSRVSIFSLSIMPYISSYIIIQILSLLYKNLNEAKNIKKNSRHEYCKYLSILISIIQGYILTLNIEKINKHGIALTNYNGYYFRIIAVITLMCGSLIILWLIDKTNKNGIINGISLIIFTSIVSETFSKHIYINYRNSKIKINFNQ